MQDHWTDWWTDGYLECKEWLREWGEINSRAMSRTVENRHILPGEYRNKKKGNDQSDWWILDDMVGGKNMDSFARAEVALIVKEKQINKIYKKWKVCKRKKKIDGEHRRRKWEGRVPNYNCISSKWRW